MSSDIENFENENIVYIDDDLILKFFKVFSRAEYALKNIADFRNGTKANWDTFANKIDKAFAAIIAKDSDLNKKRDYLWKNPPKKQEIVDDKLSFVDFVIDSGQRETQQLFLMIRTIRNNLFHGGKYTPETAEVNNTDRNKQLIESSIVIIKACMKLNNEVLEYYKVQ